MELFSILDIDVQDENPDTIAIRYETNEDENFIEHETEVPSCPIEGNDVSLFDATGREETFHQSLSK